MTLRKNRRWKIISWLKGGYGTNMHQFCAAFGIIWGLSGGYDGTVDNCNSGVDNCNPPHRSFDRVSTGVDFD